MPISTICDGGWRDSSWEAEPSCMAEHCAELITLDKPILARDDMEHLNCYDTKHFHLFLVLIFRSSSWKQKDASNSLSLSRQNATWLWMPGVAMVLCQCFGPF